MVIVHILLWILKAAGVLLLLILGLLLLGILIVLFVPVRYEFCAKGSLEKPEEAKGWISIRYFFSLIRFRAAYEKQKFHWEAGIAWKKIGQDKEEEIEEAAPEQQEKVAESPQDQTKRPERSSEAPVKTAEKGSGSEEKKDTGTKGKKEQENERTAPKESKGQAVWKKIKYTFHRICDKIKTLSEMKDRAEAFIKDEVHRAAFGKVKSTAFRFLKTWMPRKAEGYLEYGFDDPYYTGKLLSYLALFYPFFGKWLRIVPDFEKTALKGHVYVKGHLRMCHLAAAAIRLVADKNIRSTAKEVLHLVKGKKKEES